MKRALISLCLAFACCGPAAAQEEVLLWHAMSGALGAELDALVQRFNASQSQVRVVAENKGGYEDTMIAALAAQRAGNGPQLVQVYEVGTAHMMAARSAVKPVWQLMAENGEKIDGAGLLAGVAGYFSDSTGKLLALPFNVSTPILFYNKDAFRKAGLDPEKAPDTWYQMPKAMGALLDSGAKCAYTTVWPAWVQVETMSTWHNQDFATRENGMLGLDAKLIFNTHLMVRHVSMLSSWARAGYFTYAGRRVEGERRFASGECAMVTAASSSVAALRAEAKFDFGAARLPHYDDIRGAPHHSLIGGAALWALAGGKASQGAQGRGAARFLAWLLRPEVQAEWHQRTGYVPVTRAAYDLTARSGFYKDNPAHDIAIRQLLLNVKSNESRGIRLGRMQEIRLILEQELERVWSGEIPPKLALDQAAERGDALLRAFEREHRAGTEPGVPKRVPRAPAKHSK